MTVGEPTPHRKFRATGYLWRAYGRVCERLGTNRADEITEHIRALIRQHGDEQDLADLRADEEELAERRSRRGGRPRKSPES